MKAVQSSQDIDTPWWMFWKKRRYVVAVLAFFGFMNTYTLRVNLSIAIVAMTENKTTIHENGTETYGREFDWDSKTQGYILSSFFYGYITTQLLGGWLAARIGGKKIFGFGIAATSAFTLITPWLVYSNVYLFMAVRILEGIFEGVVFPSVHAIWARWAPPMDRSRLATIAFSGCYVGTVIAMPTSALLAKAFGWPSVFYFFGAVGLIWFAIWWVVVAETPEEDPHISQAELQYITEALGNRDHNKAITHPWKAILTSVPVWAIFTAHFAENWGYYTLLTQLPKFMKDILNFDLGQTGFMSGLPYVAMAFMILVSGHLADRLLVSGVLTTTQVRKSFNGIGFFGQTLFMLGVTFWLSATGATICLTLAVSLGSLAWSGFSVNYLDVAPQHASVLMGLGNTLGTIPGIISPIISGYIISTPTADEWRIVFYIASAIYLIGGIIYVVFSTAELQAWAIEPETGINNKNVEQGGVCNNTFIVDE